MIDRVFDGVEWWSDGIKSSGANLVASAQMISSGSYALKMVLDLSLTRKSRIWHHSVFGRLV